MPASPFGGSRIRSAKRQVCHPFRKWAQELAHPKEVAKEGAAKEEVPRVGVGNKEGEVAEAEHPHEDLRLLVEVALGEHSINLINISMFIFSECCASRRCYPSLSLHSPRRSVKRMQGH